MLDSGAEEVRPLEPRAAVVVGRDPDRADIVVSELYCSRAHLKIERHATGRVLVHDLDTKTGTFCLGGVGERLEIARQLVRARAELRAFTESAVAALGTEGFTIAPIGTRTLLRGTSAFLPPDALIVLPGAILMVDPRAGDTTATRPVTMRPRAPLRRPLTATWTALAEAGLEHTTLAELAGSSLRNVLPILGHLEQFQDAPRLPGSVAELDGAAYASVLRLYAEGLPEGGHLPIEVVLRGAGASDLTPRTAAIVKRYGEVRLVERVVERAADIASFQGALTHWLSIGSSSAPARPAFAASTRDELGRPPHAYAIMTGLETVRLEDDRETQAFLSNLPAVEHLVVATGDRGWVQRLDREDQQALTPAEVTYLMAYVARAIDGAGGMRAEDFANPFSSTSSGRKQAFKTMRIKVDLANSRGSYRLFRTVSTAEKGGAEYAFSPRAGATFCFVVLAADYDRVRTWLRQPTRA